MIANYYSNAYKLLSEMISEVRNLNIAVDFLRTEILNAKPQASDAKTTSSVIGFSVSQASEISDRRNRTYTFDEPVTFTPLSPPPRRKPVTHVRSMATL
jgi:hypothetical protein